MKLDWLNPQSDYQIVLNLIDILVGVLAFFAVFSLIFWVCKYIYKNLSWIFIIPVKIINELITLVKEDSAKKYKQKNKNNNISSKPFNPISSNDNVIDFNTLNK